MSKPAANAYDLATRETILDLWAQGTPTGEIADRVGLRSETAVTSFIARAREKGDVRAAARSIRRKKAGREGVFAVPDTVERATPSWEGLTPFGFMMGDPPRGRSALDQKMAAHG
ncbi:hypothetical protein [Kaistia granuli]|uniref:hypothetical protein n=1 Tax=Kaistia granuli TaxID=363259 RepID=UPI000372833D|nr:hypothetical protein [Kaistia granuli]